MIQDRQDCLIQIDKTVIQMPKTLARTVCPYCAAGCGFYIAVEKGRATGIEYMKEHPACEGALCSKGNAALEIIDHPERLARPMKRKGEGFVPITWDEALEMVEKGLKKALRDHGPEALGFLSSSKCTNEENYLMQKLARMLGSPNIDNCARLCHAPSVVGLNRALGAAGMTNPIPDMANSKCIFVIGSNFAENHPVISRWVHRAKDSGAVVIVADPRLTPSVWLSDVFLQLRPGSDVALINCMMKVIIDEGLIDRDFISLWTKGYDDLVRSLEGLTLEAAEEITGVPATDIVKAARAYAAAPASSIVYSMGITQHTTGTDNVQALANLALICGQVGKEGSGVLPLRGQNNVQGACDMGALAEFYPGYRKAGDPETERFFKEAWGVQSLPGKGLPATEMIDEAARGKVRAMYIMGEDPANSDPRCGFAAQALEGLDFLVVQDIFPTATARLADLVLPASVWAEKEGSFTGTERRVQWSEKALDPPGEAREDWKIICDVARVMGLQFDYPDAPSILREINATVPQYKGILRERLGIGGITWPCPGVDHPGTPILHTQGFKLQDGRASIVPTVYRPPRNETSRDYPFILTTGRVTVHHNAGSMTRRSPSLMEREPELFIEINPEDAMRLGVADGEPADVSSASGRTTAIARVTNRLKKGTVFMPFHFPGTNLLTTDARDEEARIPEFKVTACNIARRE